MHKRTALHGLAAATLTLGLGLVGPQAFAADPAVGHEALGVADLVGGRFADHEA